MAKYCSNCGCAVNENAVVCINCGCALQSEIAGIDKANMGLNILSFLFPIVGLVLFLVYMEKKPVSAKSYGLWALIGIVARFCLSACSMLLVKKGDAENEK